MTEQPLTKKTVKVLDGHMAYHERGEGAPILLLAQRHHGAGRPGTAARAGPDRHG